MKLMFLTAEVAKMLKVAPRAIAKWCDSGKLGSYRIPGSQSRRISREHLLRFLNEHGMPIPEEMMPHEFVPFTTRDGSVACQKCYGTLANHLTQPAGSVPNVD